MDIQTLINSSTLNTRSSIKALKQQTAYKLDVDVRRGDKITGGFGKALYKAKWINKKDSPIVLLEMKGRNISEESLLYLTLEHPHIIKTYGIVDPNGHSIGSNSILLLQEYAEDGDLANMLAGRYFVPKQNVLLEIFIQVADAMIFLSKNGIIHGDLACRNVVVFKTHPDNPKNNLVKLIDFGLTQDNSKLTDANIDLPIRYVAREILLSKGRSGYSEKSEVYSFAVLMWEGCSFAKIPYDYINDDQEVSQRKLRGERLKQPEQCDPNVYNLMTKCWEDRPNDRPNFQMIYTQLKNIQNTQSTFSRSNSILSSSPNIENSSRLSQIEYNTCRDCDLPYTDYNSHLNSCSEQQLVCHKCGDQFRRAIYEVHLNNCNYPPNDIYMVPSTSSTSSSEELDQEDLVPCEVCEKQYSIYEIHDHQKNCSRYSRPRQSRSAYDRSSILPSGRPNEKPSNRITMPPKSNDRSPLRSSRNRPDSYRLPPANNRPRIRSTNESDTNNDFRHERTPSETVQKNPRQLDTVQLPCEICGKLFDESQLRTHQFQCKEKDRQRIENKRRTIEQQKTTGEVECTYCKKMYLADEINNHENICRSNHLPILSGKRSNSVPDLLNSSSYRGISNSSDESLKITRHNSVSKSTNDVTAPKIATNTTKSTTEENNKEPSGIRKLLSRVWPFKKKGSGK